MALIGHSHVAATRGASPCASTRDHVSYPCRSKRGVHERATNRPSTGYLGSLDPPDARAGTSAWLGNLRARSTDVERRAAHSAGLALSGPLPPRAPRLD